MIALLHVCFQSRERPVNPFIVVADVKHIDDVTADGFVAPASGWLARPPPLLQLLPHACFHDVQRVPLHRAVSWRRNWLLAVCMETR